MAPIRCPNCGGFKTGPWRLGVLGLAASLFASFLLVWLMAPVGLALMGYVVWQFVAELRKRPKGRRPYGCAICGYGWDAASPPAAAAVGAPASPNLRQMGEVLLQQEAEAAAAAAAEQDRQRRVREYGWG
jgi:hypothetical protein